MSVCGGTESPLLPTQHNFEHGSGDLALRGGEQHGSLSHTLASWSSHCKLRAPLQSLFRTWGTSAMHVLIGTLDAVICTSLQWRPSSWQPTLILLFPKLFTASLSEGAAPGGKWRYVLTCFLRELGSVYRFGQPGTLQIYGLSTEWVRVCLKRSLELE